MKKKRSKKILIIILIIIAIIGLLLLFRKRYLNNSEGLTLPEFELDCDTRGVQIDTQTSVVFTLASEKAEGIIQLFQNGEYVCDFNDDGINGDTEANDGIFSVQVNVLIEKEGDVNEYIARSDSDESNRIAIRAYEPLTEEDIQDTIDVNAACGDIEASYAADDGFVPDEFRKECIKALYDEAKDYCEQNEIEYDAISRQEDGIVIDYESGITYVYQISEKDTYSGLGEKSTLNVVGFNIHPNEETPTPDYEVEHYTLLDKAADGVDREIIRQYDATLESLKAQFKDNTFVIWSGHGGYIEEDESLGLYDVTILPTGSDFNNKESYDASECLEDSQFNEELQSKALVLKNGGMQTYSLEFCITYLWINKHISSVKDSWFVFNSCNSGRDNKLLYSFISKGASAATGFSETVSTTYADACIRELVETLTSINEETGTYYNIHDAMNVVKEKCGEDDTTIIFHLKRDEGAETPARPVYACTSEDVNLELYMKGEENESLINNVLKRMFGWIPNVSSSISDDETNSANMEEDLSDISQLTLSINDEQTFTIDMEDNDLAHDYIRNILNNTSKTGKDVSLNECEFYTASELEEQGLDINEYTEISNGDLYVLEGGTAENAAFYVQTSYSFFSFGEEEKSYFKGTIIGSIEEKEEFSSYMGTLVGSEFDYEVLIPNE